MIKKLMVPVLVFLLVLSLFSCSPSPTAMSVGKNKVDASEYAYYLNHNGLSLDAHNSGTTVLSQNDLLARAHEQAQLQITNSEIIRLKCDQLGLELSDEQKDQLKEEKEALIESLGGKAAYLEYLNENMLTDRLYDKLQEYNHYYSMLYEHVSSDPANGVGSDQELRQFFADNYIQVKFIRMSTLDENGDLLDEERLNVLTAKASEVLTQINNGTMTFDDALNQHNDDPVMAQSPGGIVISKQDATLHEYSADAFAMSDGEVSSVKLYSDGYYIITKMSAPANYFDEHRDKIVIDAADWAFSNFLELSKSSTAVSVSGICQKMNFENLAEYVK